VGGEEKAGGENTRLLRISFGKEFRAKDDAFLSASAACSL